MFPLMNHREVWSCEIQWVPFEDVVWKSFSSVYWKLFCVQSLQLVMSHRFKSFSSRWRRGSVWLRSCWFLWACLPCAGSQTMSSTCTAPSTTTRWICRWPTSSSLFYPGSSASPRPASTRSRSTCSVRVSADTSTGQSYWGAFTWDGYVT